MLHDALVIEAADVRHPEAVELIARLSEELARRYGDDDGVGDFRPTDVEVPRSGFLMARWEGRPVACGAFRPLTQTMAEMTRMYVDPAYRGRGIGRALLADLEERAKAAGYTTVRLETGVAQPEAVGLYDTAGYYRIPCYGYYHKDPRSVCFEKVLTAPP